jgi:hypothetical protein
MISFLTVLTSLFLLATQVLAQGRPGVTRGQIFFGCYTSRPTGNTQTPATQVANSASFSGCLVSLPHSLPSFGIRQGSMLIHRPTVALSLHLLCSDTGKLQPSNVGAVPYCSYRTFNRLRMHPALLPSGRTDESRLRLRPTELRLVDRSRMSVWLLRPIRK